MEQHARERAARKQAIQQIIAPPMQLCLPAPDQVSVQTIDFAGLIREQREAVAAADTGCAADSKARPVSSAC